MIHLFYICVYLSSCLALNDRSYQLLTWSLAHAPWGWALAEWVSKGLCSLSTCTAKCDISCAPKPNAIRAVQEEPTAFCMLQHFLLITSEHWSAHCFRKRAVCRECAERSWWGACPVPRASPQRTDIPCIKSSSSLSAFQTSVLSGARYWF